MSIICGKQEWDEGFSDTVIKCFKRIGLYPEAEVAEDEDDPFEGKELSSLQLLVNSLNASCPARELVVMTTLKCAPVWYTLLTQNGEQK